MAGHPFGRLLVTAKNRGGDVLLLPSLRGFLRTGEGLREMMGEAAREAFGAACVMLKESPHVRGRRQVGTVLMGDVEFEGCAFRVTVDQPDDPALVTITRLEGFDAAVPEDAEPVQQEGGFLRLGQVAVALAESSREDLVMVPRSRPFAWGGNGPRFFPSGALSEEELETDVRLLRRTEYGLEERGTGLDVRWVDVEGETPTTLRIETVRDGLGGLSGVYCSCLERQER